MKAAASIAAVCAAGFLAFAAPCKAIIVEAGQSAILPGTTLADRPELAGTSLAPNSFTLIGSTVPGEFDAKLLFDVIREPSGDLDFTYQVIGSVLGPAVKWQVVVPNLMFSAYDTDVRLDTPGIDAPIMVRVDANGVATFSSDVPLGAGEQTHVFFIHAAGIRDFRQDGPIELVTDFGSEPLPTGEGSPNGTFFVTGYTVLPEPLSVGMLALAVGALGLRFRRGLR